MQNGVLLYMKGVKNKHMTHENVVKGFALLRASIESGDGGTLATLASTELFTGQSEQTKSDEQVREPVVQNATRRRALRARRARLPKTAHYPSTWIARSCPQDDN